MRLYVEDWLNFGSSCPMGLTKEINRLRLLFTGGGGAASEALARLLGFRYEVYFADADAAAKPGPIADSHWLQIPMATAPEFPTAVVELCRRLAIDLLIPAVDEELLPIARLPQPLGFEVLLPPERFVARHLDKLTSNCFLHDCSLPAPRSVAADQGRLDFPCIAKPRSGRGSRNVVVVRSEAELQAHILLSRMAPEEFVLQERVEGQEYTVMMAADREGRLRAVVPVLVERKRGITLRAATRCDPEVIAACREIHAADPVAGCYNIQLIRTKHGAVKPFEINPRISTTACLGLAAGVDFAGIFLGRVPADPSGDGLLPVRDGLGLRRSWQNEFIEPAGA